MMNKGHISSYDPSLEKNLRQAINPYLPCWEYVPDGEPYLFGDRVYVYGSHDVFGESVYCPGDYVCWSAPANDLGAWRYEGVIYKKSQDPHNADLQGNLYAPDVCVGPDGRYYLYYVLSNWGVVSVAVCDTPAGQYEFLGYVRYPDGQLLGQAKGDEPQFDPGVLMENGRVYLYTGFCPRGDRGRHGAMCTVLKGDMLTVERAPVFVAPGCEYSGGTGFEEHAFFEAPSIRKVDGQYCFIYSSEKCHELCWALSDRPDGGFRYMGVLVSGCDMGIADKKPAQLPLYYTANNHGSIIELENQWYVFYHRHTNGTNYARQGCFERLHRDAQGRFLQAEITSCGGVSPLRGEGAYPTYIACNLFTETPCVYVPWSGFMDDRFPRITQQPVEKGQSYIANLRPGATAGFKYFDIKKLKAIAVRTMGYATGFVKVSVERNGPALCQIPIGYANVWQDNEAPAQIPDGVHALYFTFEGEGFLQFSEFRLIADIG